MPDVPFTIPLTIDNRASAVRGWAYDAIMQRPDGLSAALGVGPVSVAISGSASEPLLTVTGAEAQDMVTNTEIDLAEAAGLLLGAADAVRALSVLADAEHAPTTTNTRED